MSINSSSNAHPWFVDFQDVWLAYNDELLQQNHFAVEAIDLKVRQGEFIAIVIQIKTSMSPVKCIG